MSNRDEAVFEIIRQKLGLSDHASIVREAQIGSNLRYRPDLIIEDYNTSYVVEIKRNVSLGVISELSLMRDVMERKDGPPRNIRPVVVGRLIPPDIKQLAEDVGIEVIIPPPSFFHTVGKNDTRDTTLLSETAHTKITPEKAWRAVSYLLKEGPLSIRRIALKEDISYGWAHRVVSSLLERGIAERTGSLVLIKDVNRLLNGVAWERPFENLKVCEVVVPYNNAFEAARDLSQSLKADEGGFAFTSYTAASLYTGYGARHDTAYLYLDKKCVPTFKSEYGGEVGDIKIKVYAPDRDVFTSKRERESVTITSPEQTLLDVAGLGYSGMDMTKAMVDKYASL